MYNPENNDIEVLDHPLSEVYESHELHESQEPSHELLKIKETVSYIKNTDNHKVNPTEYLETCYRSYKEMANFISENGGELQSDVNKIYYEFGRSNVSPMIVRREDPEKVLSLCEGFDISLSFDPKVTDDVHGKYENCAIWPYGSNQVSGIKAAFMEGRGTAGPIVMVVGVKQNPKSNHVEKFEGSVTRTGIDREAVRVATGNLCREDLKFIILRYQKKFFPSENLTDKEKASDVTQIFRGFKFE